MSGTALLDERGWFGSGGCGGEAAHEVPECVRSVLVRKPKKLW